jgi:uncharacterized cupin superfamily protein
VIGQTHLHKATHELAVVLGAVVDLASGVIANISGGDDLAFPADLAIEGEVNFFLMQFGNR